MKLLYATSIVLPSALANRRQVLSMAGALYQVLGDDFLLGIAENNEAKPDSYVVELGRAKSPLLAWRYLKLARQRGVHMVYTREDRLLFFLWCYSKLLRYPLKLWFEVHTLKHDYFLRFALRRATGVIAVTEGLKRDAAVLGAAPERTLVAHDAVDPERFISYLSRLAARQEVGIPAEARVAAYIGRYTTMGQSKGIDELIQAVGMARRRESNTHLLVVGLTKEELQTVAARAEELGVPESDRTLVPYVPQEKLPLYLRSADILVMNFPNTPHYAHHMSPMKLFEYMAAGVPILTTDLPSVREVLDEKSAFFTPPGDTEALTGALVSITKNDDEARARAVRAQTLVLEHYTWQHRARKILAFLGH